ncbi:DoxX family protein [Niabella ginsengisoli]|uniref:DoxX family protein n=1 Tax=Niabella ginsengisoli TaxID=522298 RepID=A0ABS9SQY0_9BACT|nr:DoxX family protein [Niabella ginsengisoli]MCH5600790.1 DoxX family protein [Niabella ginsengisoli]
MKIFIWLLRIAVAFILINTVIMHKFRATEETLYIFETIGMEPYGRIATGIVELIAGILILIPRTSGYGALLGLGTMAGAIYFHLTTLGIEVLGDGGELFYMAIGVFVACLVLVIIHRKQILLPFRKAKSGR